MRARKRVEPTAAQHQAHRTARRCARKAAAAGRTPEARACAWTQGGGGGTRVRMGRRRCPGARLRLWHRAFSPPSRDGCPPPKNYRAPASPNMPNFSRSALGHCAESRGPVQLYLPDRLRTAAEAPSVPGTAASARSTRGRDFPRPQASARPPSATARRRTGRPLLRTSRWPARPPEPQRGGDRHLLRRRPGWACHRRRPENVTVAQLFGFPHGFVNFKARKIDREPPCRRLRSLRQERLSCITLRF